MSHDNEHEHCGCGCDHNHEHEHDSHGCGCGCDHEHDEHTMKLVLEDGSELECSVIDIFATSDDAEEEYIALLPVGEDEVLLYRYNEFEDGSFELLNIESEEEFEAVEKVFFEMFEEDTFIDDDDFFGDEDYEYEDEDDLDDDDE